MNMTDYLLTTSVTAEALSPVFEEAVRVTCCKDYTPSQVEAWVQRATSSRWQELLSGDLHFLAAVSQPSGEVAGFISVRGDGYLHSLFVHPAHQRRGVASFLLRAAEEEARRSEAPDLFSEVSLTAKPFFPDEAAAYDDSAFHCFLLHVTLDAVGIVYISQGEDAFGINARQRRTYGRGTRREQQFVVRFGIGLSGRTNGYFLLLHVDGCYF